MLTRKTQQQGFNLIELMIVVAVAAILIGIGLPSLKLTIDRNAVSAETTRIARSINFARAQAVTQSQVVTLERKSSTANVWSDGWTIYLVDNDTPNQTMAAADTLLRDIEISGQSLDLKTNNTGNRWISFGPSGRLLEGGASVIITICDRDQSTAYAGSQIDINPVGRVRISAIDGPNKAANCQ